ncbi:MAG: hypothetical protein ACXVCX_20230 [Ktedonobacterales bacterium]
MAARRNRLGVRGGGILRYYTGIGAHATPPHVLDLMVAIARYYARQGIVLRSGGSPGADVAFELGCGEGRKEIYVPWAGFNGNASLLVMTDDLMGRVTGSRVWRALREALAAETPPADLDANPEEQRRLYARDVCQVLGADLITPSERVICWTPPSGEPEGTRIALYVARDAGIPIDNLSDPAVEERWRRLVDNQ